MKLKKFILIGGIAAVGLGLVGGFGVIKTWAAYAKQHVQAWADENTPPEQEIQRLKTEVAKLDEQENKIKNALAKEIFACEKLEGEKRDLELAVTKEEEQTRALGEAIKTAADPTKVSVGNGKPIKMAEAMKKLDADTKAVSARQKELKARTEGLALHSEHKTLLRGQLDELRAAKNELNSDLDALALEYQALKLKGMKAKNYKDDSKLSEVRQSIAKLKERVGEKRIRVGLDEEKAVAEPTNADVDEMLNRINNK